MYDDRPSPWLTGLTLCLAWLATYTVAPVLAEFWHVDEVPPAVFVLWPTYAVLAAWLPWLYTLTVPALAAVLYFFPAIREGLWLDLTVWYTDMRLGYFPGPQGLMAWGALGLALLGFGFLFVRESLRRGTALWSFFAGTLAFGHMWLWGSEKAAAQFAFFLIAVVPLWAVGGAAAREQKWYGAGRRVVEGTAWIGGFVLALVLAALAAWALPARDRPLEFWGVTAWARATFPALEQMRGTAGADDFSQVPTGFTLTTAGFARRLTELGGPIRPDDGVALTVTFPGALPESPVYLRGTAMTNYNGRGWALETKSGDVGIDSPPTASELTLQIDLVGLGETTLFYPRELASLKGVNFNFGREGHIYATEPLKGSYTVTAYLPGGRPVGFAAPQFDPGKYLALPKSLPARVGALAEELTRGTPTPYDEALAIEEYLRTFSYAFDVPATPPGRDFVDYFLYDLKKGYCAYSATAMTVMLRTQGIPARWVQGFVVEPGGAKVDVTWNYAHAWVEAYFPGYGWTIFDPTPRFSRIARSEAAPQGEFRTVPVVTLPVPQNATLPDESPGAKTSPWSIPWAWIAAAAAALVWVATSFRRFYRERIDWNDERAGVLRSYRLLLAALRRMGFGQGAHQTPLEHASAVAGAWPDVGDHVRRAAAHATAARFAPPAASAPQGARRAMGGALAAVWFGAQHRWGALRTAWIRFRFLWGKD